MRRKQDVAVDAAALYGDLLDRELPEFPGEVDTVYHLAGIAHSQASDDLYERVNVEGSLKVASAAINAGVRRFVFVSSVKATLVDDQAKHKQKLDQVFRQHSRQQSSQQSSENAHKGFTKQHSYNPISSYAISKARAEVQLKELCASSAMQLFIVRPALVYDSEAPGHLAMLKRWCRWRLPAPPERGGRSMVARSDLVRLLLSLHHTTAWFSQPITVTDGQKYSTARIHRAFSSAMTLEPLLPSIPDSVWRLCATIYERLRGLPPGSTLDRIFGEEMYESSGLEELGFSPRSTLESALGIHE